MKPAPALVCTVLAGCGLVLDLDSESQGADAGSADAAAADVGRADAALDGPPADDAMRHDGSSVDGGSAIAVDRLLAGWRHTCVLDGSGAVWCWGRDDFGQVSGSATACDTTSGCRLAPLLVGDAMARFRAPLGASEEHTCAIALDDRRTCWGVNVSGELGVGDTSPHPGLIPSDSEGWTHFTGGQDHMCGLRDDKSLWCWGDNGDGSVGDGTTTDRSAPVQIPGRWRAVDAGLDFTCAIDEDDALYCWGENDFGQLGPIAVAGDVTPFPVEIDAPAPASWADVSAGEDHACALLADGSAWCWGINEDLQLGSSATEVAASSVPLRVDGGPYRTIEAGGDHACALGTDGQLWCWGQNSDGELGIGSTGGDSLPAVVAHPAGGTFDVVVAGREHTCALDSTGDLWCWGNSDHGQLGLGDRVPRPVPTRVTY